MSNKRYSNKGVNSAARAKAAATAAQEGKKQTLIICAVAIAVVILAVVLAIVLGGSDDKSTDNTTTTTQATTTTAPSTTTTAPAESNADMTAIKAEIDSMSASDFAETTETTEYVKLTIQHYGDVIIRLRSDIAPITVKNFQELVGKGFYNGLTFHRIMKGFMIQGGAPKDSSTSLSTIKGEFSANGVQNDLSHITGVISMARTDVMNSATSQFFICNADASSSLDKKYAGFGYVVAGLDVILTVSEVEVKANASGENSTPVQNVIIEKICFVEKVSAETEAGSETITESVTEAVTEAVTGSETEAVTETETTVEE